MSARNKETTMARNATTYTPSAGEQLNAAARDITATLNTWTTGTPEDHDDPALASGRAAIAFLRAAIAAWEGDDAVAAALGRYATAIAEIAVNVRAAHKGTAA